MSEETVSSFKKRTAYRTAVFVAFAAFAAIGLLASLRFGSLKLSFPEMLRAIFLSEGMEHSVICHVRLPRVLVAAMTGICLAVSGAILQGVMRNPLASPGIIGVSAGGGLAAMLIMIALPQFFHMLVPVAFLGALGATLAIYLLAWEHGVKPMKLILAGVAVSSLLGACINILLISYPDRVAGVVDFMVGSFTARSWRHVQMLWPYAAGGTIAALFMARRLDLLLLGDEAAASLGLNVERTRMILIAISALLAAAAVSVAGLLGFVGLIVPHIVRMILGPDNRLLIPGCALFGAGLLTSCDLIGRVFRDPQELPVGIIMALLGAPFFLYLLRKGAANVGTGGH